ncbi:restriction endonuclease [Pseudophaeobacter flagellatus]|uniref:restriction endonuclease n=1 Tax=Pseudophaeobacter flagellatus TaxID=2899119 RepID=UPI001E3CDB9A|nr:restriction endonuclease [Pseudophaeobacter flagellatus]MCD9147225.1 restriction endonuclease [Pseudophaeobacter flagellatus]
MSLPNMNDVMFPCLVLLSEGATNAKECQPGLKSHFSLSDAEMDERIPSGMRTRVFDRADWAIFHMMKAGLIERPKRGYYVVSQLGMKAISNGSARSLSLSALKEFPLYKRWKSEGTASKEDVETGGDKDLGATPREQLETAFKVIDEALANDVLAAVLSLSPARFEKLVVDLLLSMGYGGGALERGLQTNVSNDGGIDGIINEDELGLDAVYIQAKRYASENKVGRPALNAFVGSLTGEGASKGVFVTTSDFSKDAMEYVDRVQHRIVLINGDRLARLMIKHEVGVRARKTLVLRSVDEDYFSET